MINLSRLIRDTEPDTAQEVLERAALFGNSRAQYKMGVSVPRVTAAFDDLLPVRIDEAEVQGPTLMLRGDGWASDFRLP